MADEEDEKRYTLTKREVIRWRTEKKLQQWYLKPLLLLLDLILLIAVGWVAWRVLGIFQPEFVSRVDTKVQAISESKEPAYAFGVELCTQARRRLPSNYADAICGTTPPGSSALLSTNEVDFDAMSQETGYTNVELLKTMYEHGQICRGRDGFPAESEEDCAYFPWSVAAAIPAGETTTSEWATVDPRKPGVWGMSLGYNDAESQFPPTQAELAACAAKGVTHCVSSMASACREGLAAVASNPFVQTRWPGIQANQIYTSSGCSIGRGQTLAVHFRPGGLMDKLENKDVWTSYDAGVEAIYVHLTARGSGACGNGKSWFDNRDDPAVDAVELALCSYNPGAYGESQYQWYWDALHETAASLDKSYNAQSVARLPVAPNPGDCQHDFCLVHPGGIPNPTYNFYHNYNGAFGFGQLQHQAQDFSPPDGPGIPFPVYAACTGSVTRYEQVSSNAGGVVGITCDQRPDITVEYMHLDRTTMTDFGLETKFMAGQEVAIADGSGSASDGVHLHFKVKIGGVPVDPMEWIGSAAPGSVVPQTPPSEPIKPIFDGLRELIPTQTVEDVLELVPSLEELPIFEPSATPMAPTPEATPGGAP